METKVGSQGYPNIYVKDPLNPPPTTNRWTEIKLALKGIRDVTRTSDGIYRTAELIVLIVEVAGIEPVKVVFSRAMHSVDVIHLIPDSIDAATGKFQEYFEESRLAGIIRTTRDVAFLVLDVGAGLILLDMAELIHLSKVGAALGKVKIFVPIVKLGLNKALSTIAIFGFVLDIADVGHTLHQMNWKVADKWDTGLRLGADASKIFVETLILFNLANFPFLVCATGVAIGIGIAYKVYSTEPIKELIYLKKT